MAGIDKMWLYGTDIDAMIFFLKLHQSSINKLLSKHIDGLRFYCSNPLPFKWDNYTYIGIKEDGTKFMVTNYPEEINRYLRKYCKIKAVRERLAEQYNKPEISLAWRQRSRRKKYIED